MSGFSFANWGRSSRFPIHRSRSDSVIPERTLGANVRRASSSIASRTGGPGWLTLCAYRRRSTAVGNVAPLSYAPSSYCGTCLLAGVSARVATSARTKTDAHGIFGLCSTSASENPLPLPAVAAYTGSWNPPSFSRTPFASDFVGGSPVFGSMKNGNTTYPTVRC